MIFDGEILEKTKIDKAALARSLALNPDQVQAWHRARKTRAMLRVLCPCCHVEMQPLPQVQEVVCRQPSCPYEGVRFHAPTVELVQSE